jgi:hypothetical protein
VKFRRHLIVFILIFFLSGNFCRLLCDNEEITPAIQILLGKLFSPNQKERINAALKLADYNHKRVISSLINVSLGDKSEMVRRVAIRSLGRIGAPEAIPAIMESMASESNGIKIEAMGAAVNFSTPSVKNALIAKANSNNPIIRQNAVVFLGEIKNNNITVVNTIIDKFKDISEGVRVSACKVSGKKKIEKAVPALDEILKSDRSDIVREYAAKALGEINSPKVQEVLKRHLDDTSPAVRIIIAKSLALAGSRAGLSEAIEAIKSPAARIRVLACDVIGLAGNRKSAIFLEQALNDYDRRVQRAADKALKEINKKNKKG